MNRNEHLETYNLKLITRAPLFIGSGKTCAKTDYVLSPNGAEIICLDQEKLFRLLTERNLADKYEEFILSGGTDMYGFLTDTCRIPWRDAEKLAQYRVKSGDALDRRHSLKIIQVFVRDGEGRAYVPGSSVKGALRTTFLYDRMSEDKEVPVDTDNRRRLKDSPINEAKYINTLRYVNDRKNKTRGDMVSSIMQGVRISDSIPIDHARMMLADKNDAMPDGTVHKLNVCRECVRPDTEIDFVLTLDRSVVGDSVTAESLMNAINRFTWYYMDHYIFDGENERFLAPEQMANVYWDNSILLGGGAGFFSKTLAYPYFGGRAGEMVQDFMANTFRRHGHERDLDRYGISPHTMKYAMYEGDLYPMGLCEVSIS